jgi:hypothetical protein
LTPDGEARDWARWARLRGEGELRQILYWCWDPIGVTDGFPINADEYDGYVPGLLSLLRESSGASDVAAYLRRIEREEMGLRPRSKRRLRDVASRILSWYEQSLVLHER